MNVNFSLLKNLNLLQKKLLSEKLKLEVIK